MCAGKDKQLRAGHKRSLTVKIEKHKPCGFSYMVVRSDGAIFGPFTHRGSFRISRLASESWKGNARKYDEQKATSYDK